MTNMTILNFNHPNKLDSCFYNLILLFYLYYSLLVYLFNLGEFGRINYYRLVNVNHHGWWFVRVWTNGTNGECRFSTQHSTISSTFPGYIFFFFFAFLYCSPSCYQILSSPFFLADRMERKRHHSPHLTSPQPYTTQFTKLAHKMTCVVVKLSEWRLGVGKGKRDEN